MSMMNRVTRRCATLALLLPFATAPAQEVPTSWGVQASTHWAECTVFVIECNLLGLTMTPINETSRSGGLNQTMAEELNVTQNAMTFIGDPFIAGTASASVNLDLAQAGVPVLRAAASSIDDRGWVSGFAFAIAGWTYTGPPGTVELSAFLDGFVTNPPTETDENGIDSTALSYVVYAIRDDGSEVFPDPPPSTINELFAAIDELPVEDSWGPEDLSVQGNTTPEVVSAATPAGDPITLTFSADDIANGNTGFYIVAGLVAGATYPGHSADAMSTLTMQFADASNLVSSAQPPAPANSRAVPVPALALYLLAAALMAVALAWQRRRMSGP